MLKNDFDTASMPKKVKANFNADSKVENPASCLQPRRNILLVLLACSEISSIRRKIGMTDTLRFEMDV